MKSIDIFPWNDNFNTGIGKIDEQHRKLVQLLNMLASHVAFQSDLPATSVIFDELSEYAIYHFQTEEKIWHENFPEDPLETSHIDVHLSFVSNIVKLKDNEQTEPSNKAIEEVLAFLTRWLASHILENDRYMAMVVLAKQSGMTLEAAKAHAREQMSGSTKALIDIILSIYESLSANTLYLMRELVQHKRTDKAIHGNQELIQSMLENSPIATRIATLGGRKVVFANNRYAKLINSDRDETFGADPKNYYANPSDYEEILEQLDHGKTVKDKLIELSIPKVGTVWTLSSYMKIVYENEPAILGWFYDVTERKKVEQLLVDSEKRYRTLVEWTPEPVAVHADGKFLYANPAAVQMFGAHSIDELIGKSIMDRIPVDYHSIVLARVEKQTKEDVAVPMLEEKFLKLDGTLIDVEVQATPIIFEGKKAFQVAMRDITKRKQTELALKAENEKNIAILRNASDGIHILDAGGHVIEASDSFCRMLGYTREEVVGMHASQWDSVFKTNEIIQLIDQQLCSNTRSQFESRHRRKDGTIFDVEISGYPVELWGKRMLFNSSRDITDRKKAARQLENTKNDLLEAQRIAHMGSWSLNIATKEITWSEELYLMQGLDPRLPAPDLAKSQKLFMPESWERLSNAIALTVTTGTPYNLELETVRANGSHGWILGHGEAVRDEGGAIVSVRGVAEDITERKLSDIALKESELRYQSIFDMNPLPMWIIDDSTLTFLMVNHFAVVHYGYTREEFCRMTLRDIRPKEDVEELDRIISSSPNRRAVGEWRHMTRDGSIIDVIVNTTPIVYGNRSARIAIIQDITERKRVEKSLSVTASVFGISQEAITITDADNNIIDVNPAFTSITGFSRDEVIGKNPNILNSGRQSKEFYENMWTELKNEGVWRGEIWNRRKSGEIFPEMLSISVLRDITGKVLTHVAVFSDISKLKQHEDDLVRVAHFDGLTGIPNRILLADRMKQAIFQASRDNNLMAVCYLDLDGFKPINDTMGHQVGDNVLIEISRRIGLTIRGGDTVARLGGDEFVVLLVGLTKGEECVTTIERILEAIAAPIAIKHKTVTVTASIGVSIYPLDEDDQDTLLRHADQAMYIAKQSGKNRFHIFDVDLDKRTRDQNNFLKSIRFALEQNQFELHYQPKVNLRTKKLVGVEALIRWRHPERGILPPAEFLRQIEHTDLDIEIGEWVAKTALAQMDKWMKVGFDIEVSINISGYHLESTGFVGKM